MDPRHRFLAPPLTVTPANGVLAAVVGTPADGDVVTWDATAGNYKPAAPSGGGGGGASIETILYFLGQVI